MPDPDGVNRERRAKCNSNPAWRDSTPGPDERLPCPAVRQCLPEVSAVRGCVRRELPELVSDHLLGDGEVVVDLAVVDLEPQADKVGKDGGGAGLSLDRRRLLARGRSDNGQAVSRVRFACLNGCTSFEVLTAQCAGL